jgi:hypothetical protein
MLMLGVKAFRQEVDYGSQAVEMMLETSMCFFFNRILTKDETVVLDSTTKLEDWSL